LNGFAGVAQISNLLYRRASSLRDLGIIAPKSASSCRARILPQSSLRNEMSSSRKIGTGTHADLPRRDPLITATDLQTARLVLFQVSQAGSPAIQQIGNLRYSGEAFKAARRRGRLEGRV